VAERVWQDETWDKYDSRGSLGFPSRFTISVYEIGAKEVCVVEALYLRRCLGVSMKPVGEFAGGF